MTQKSQFSHYDVVRVVNPPASSEHVDGVDYVVLGISQDDGGPVYYGISAIDGFEVSMCCESLLTPTGRKLSASDIYPDKVSLKVIVDPKTGEGSLKNPD